MQLKKMKEVDIRTIPKEELKDIREVTVYETDDPVLMVEHLQKELGNLYVHKRGNVAICNEYTPGKTINQVFGILVSSS